MLIKKWIFLTGIFLVVVGSSFGQSKDVFVEKVTLEASASEWTRIWINDVQIAEIDPLGIDETKRKTKLKIDIFPNEVSLKRKNVLAFEMNQEIQSDQSFKDKEHTGVAYILTIRFSDSSLKVFTSDDDADNTLCYRINAYQKTDPEPTDWSKFGFDDGGWKPAGKVNPISAILSPLKNPNNGEILKCLDAFDASHGVVEGTVGQRALFRKKIILYELKEKLTPTPVPSATWTPIPIPTFSPVPTFTPRPRPTRTHTPRPTIQPRPTATLIPRKKKVVLPPTATPFIPPVPTDTPVRRVKWKPTATMTPKQVPTDTPEPMKALSSPESIVFVSPPVNIRVSFADGPGRYRLEVQSADGNSLKVLYDKKVTFDREAWITWDGTNEGGKLMPLGTYYARFSKDGKLLKKIALVWIKEDEP